MEYTKQQLQGYKGYNPRIRVGNWNSDIDYEEMKLRSFLEKKEKGLLVSQKIQARRQCHLQPVQVHSTPSDGFARFGLRVLVFHVQSEGYLSVNLDVVHPGSTSHFDVTTATTSSPCARNVFVIERVDAKDDKFRSMYVERGESNILHYGQPFRLVSCDELSSDPLFLSSELQTSSSFALKSHNQEVYMSPKCKWDATWTLEYPDPSYRIEYEGQPVELGTALLITHVHSTQPLASDKNISETTEFGIEYEVMCGRMKNIHKVEDSRNHFCFVCAPPGDGMDYEGTEVSYAPKEMEHASSSLPSAKQSSRSLSSVPPNTVSSDVPLSIQILLDRVRLVLKERGTTGIAELARMFRVADSSGDHRLSVSEFFNILRGYGIQFSRDEFETLIDFIDRDSSGLIDFDEFLRAIRGDLNATRKAAVRAAFEKFDVTGDGVVTIDDLRDCYCVKRHPKVLSGSLTEEQALMMFLSTFDTASPDGSVTWEDFVDYYRNISASFDVDSHFVQSVESAWDRVRPRSDPKHSTSHSLIQRLPMDVESIIKKIREALIRRDINGIAALGRGFRIMDKDNSHCLDREELRIGLRNWGIDLLDKELDRIVSVLDTSGNGLVDYEEFLFFMRGPLSLTRKAAIRVAFDHLDTDGSGEITVDDIRHLYCVRRHPKVVRGEMTPDQVLTEFLNTFDGGIRDGIVRYDEFERFYAGVSASIDLDEYFVEMMRSVWPDPSSSSVRKGSSLSVF